MENLMMDFLQSSFSLCGVSTSSEESVGFRQRPAVLASLSRPLISTELLLLLAALTSSLSAGPWGRGRGGGESKKNQKE